MRASADVHADSRKQDFEAAVIAEHARKVLNWENATLSESYFYQSLPLCVIDSVYSIGANYTSTLNTVETYCRHKELRRHRNDDSYPNTCSQLSISEFCADLEAHSIKDRANLLFRNNQRTSTTGASIPKAEAVLRFSIVLRDFGVDYFQDLDIVRSSQEFEDSVKSIPGQRSGISLRYFWMLTGSDEYIKPDRMIFRFIESALQRKIDIIEAETLVKDAASLLKLSSPTVTARLLDHMIWQHERARSRVA